MMEVHCFYKPVEPRGGRWRNKDGESGGVMGGGRQRLSHQSDKWEEMNGVREDC